MYEGNQLETAMLNYTVDSLFALYTNLLKYDRKMRIQATVGVIVDDNNDNTKLVTFNIERNKSGTSLVKCSFEEEVAPLCNESLDKTGKETTDGQTGNDSVCLLAWIELLSVDQL